METAAAKFIAEKKIDDELNLMKHNYYMRPLIYGKAWIGLRKEF